MLSDEEIIRCLKLVRHSSIRERQGRRLLSMSRVAREAGLNRTYVLAIVAGTKPLTPFAKRKLSPVLTCLHRERVRAEVPLAEPFMPKPIDIRVIFGPSRIN